MKKCILLFLFMFMVIFVGCEKDPTIELAPTITTGDATDIQCYSAKIETSINDISNVSELGIICDINSTFNSEPLYGNIYSFDNGNNNIYIDGLAFNKKYYCKAFAKDSKGNCIYGNVSSFTTLDGLISLVTGSGVNRGYDSSKTYPYQFSVSGSIIGLYYISSWGVKISEYSDFSICSSELFPQDNYSEGEIYTQYWGWKYSGLRYFKIYAVLKTGATVYGNTKTVYLSK